MRRFIVEPLSTSTARTAFPLIRAVVPALTIDGWLASMVPEVGSERTQASGIIIARDAGAMHPIGLATYRCEPGLGGERILVVDHVVAFGLLDIEPIVAALLHQLERIAGELDCEVIESRLRGQTCDLAGAFLKTGHVRDGFLLRKPVSTKPAAS